MILNPFISGAWWNNISYGVFQFKTAEGNLFMTYVEARMQTPQNLKGKLAWILMALAVLTRCLCSLSTLPFCWGVLGTLLWCSIPCFLNTSEQKSWKNYVPLSLLMHLIYLWTDFAHMQWNSKYKWALASCFATNIPMCIWCGHIPLLKDN